MVECPRHGDPLRPLRGARRLCAVVLGAWLAGPGGPGAAAELLYAPEGNRLRVIDVASIGRRPLAERILIERASLDPARGRDINGPVCALPDGSGRFVAGEDTGQPERAAGWGVFTRDGRQVGKLVASSAARAPEPYGCAFDPQGRLLTTEIGDPGFRRSNGQLILWFPPYDRFPGRVPGEPEDPATPGAASGQHCKLATDLGTPGGVAVDGRGRVYVATASGMQILRFSPPFPTGPDAAGGCGQRDALGAPLADAVQREVFSGPRWRAGLVTYTGLAFAPNGNLYASSVFTGRIGEFDPQGRLVRLVLRPRRRLPLPPFATGSPQGLAVDAQGALYYADLDLRWSGWRVGPGPNGRIWRIGFGADGAPSAPLLVREGLAFPDGLAFLPGELPDE